MEEDDDDEIKLLRASAGAITDIKVAVQYVTLQETRSQTRDFVANHMFCQAKLGELISRLNLFLEEPQLLDPHLKDIIPPLVTRFLSLVNSQRTENVDDRSTELFLGLAEALYTLCKVRGEKVIVRFLDNEPRHLRPFMDLLKRAKVHYGEQNRSGSDLGRGGDLTFTPFQADTSTTWQLRYVLVLWLGHLVLTPFDLTSIAEGNDNLEITIRSYLTGKVPSITRELIEIFTSYMDVITKEQTVAATGLVKLTLRPDERESELLNSLTRWAIDCITPGKMRPANTSRSVGTLIFLNRLMKSAKLRDTRSVIVPIYEKIHQVFNTDSEQFRELQESSVCRKLSVKILRNIVTQLFSEATNPKGETSKVRSKMLFEKGAIEEVIEFCLKSLADRDTPVRYAASKALSVVTSKLDKDLGLEVVQAIIGSLNEDVLEENGSRILTAVNPLRWHGLTLTLSHMLFQRSPSVEQLEEVLEALFLTLTFEQRLSTGNSIGVNVRDAANFGFWSLARRYSTKELLAAKHVSPLKSRPSLTAESMIQVTANQLLVTACLDPSGNVRRGSSAALQELIGRHPDTVMEGISLVQVVDYQAVALRSRAMINICGESAKLGTAYLSNNLVGLFGWRGIQAPDTVSRDLAATAIGRLAVMLSEESLQQYMDDILMKLRNMPRREMECRHGLVKALSEIIRQKDEQASEESWSQSEEPLRYGFLANIPRVWDLFDDELKLSGEEMKASSTRPELTTAAVLSLVSALGSTCLRLGGTPQADSLFSKARPTENSLGTLTVCLRTADEQTLVTVPLACERVFRLLSVSRRIALSQLWIQQLSRTIGTPQRAGTMIALASISGILGIPDDLRSQDSEETDAPQQNIVDILIEIFQKHNIPARVMAIRSLAIVVDSISRFSSHLSSGSLQTKIVQTLEVALNDYTINERGDVGSLVRIEALAAVENAWKVGVQRSVHRYSLCQVQVQRLALERLDKVRLLAARCLRTMDVLDPHTRINGISDVSSYEYYYSTAMRTLKTNQQQNLQNGDEHTNQQLLGVLEGFASSTGAGSESLIQIARSALFDVLEGFPTRASSTTSKGTCLIAVGNCLITIFEKSHEDERILLPLLEMTSFLLDVNILQRLDAKNRVEDPSIVTEVEAQPFKFRTLLSLVQKSHFKSTNLPKLLSALHVYRGLAEVDSVRGDVLRKVSSMLGHPFPKVRLAAAETLWALTEDEKLMNRDWGRMKTTEGKRLGEVFLKRWNQ